MARGNGHLEWESSKDEKYAEQWWTDHGFTWKLTKRFVSKSVYAVTKDDITLNYEIPNDSRLDIHGFMEGPAGFDHHWMLYVEYCKLCEQAKGQGLI